MERFLRLNLWIRKMINPEYDSTYESDCLKCPYCEQEDKDAWEINFNDDKVEIECDCGKKFWGEMVQMISYRGEADCELNGNKHALESTGNKGQSKCKICGQYIHDALTELSE